MKMLFDLGQDGCAFFEYEDASDCIAYYDAPICFIAVRLQDKQPLVAIMTDDEYREYLLVPIDDATSKKLNSEELSLREAALQAETVYLTRLDRDNGVFRGAPVAPTTLPEEKLPAADVFVPTMERYLVIEMPDGSEWQVRAYHIARHRADRLSEYEGGPTEWHKVFGETLCNPDILIGWAASRMDWSDVSAEAVMVSPPKIDYQEGWVRGKKRVEMKRRHTDSAQI